MLQIMQYINEISYCDRVYRNDRFAPMGIKGCHGKYLREICRNPGIFQEQLTTSVLVNKSNVARQAAALEEDGFIERRTCCNDKRMIRLYPTQKTLDLLPQIEQVLDGWREDLVQDLTQEEQSQLIGLLEKLRGRAMEKVGEP